MRNVSEISCRGNHNTKFIFFKSYLLWDNVEKLCRAGQTTEGNMVHAYCMLDT